MSAIQIDRFPTSLCTYGIRDDLATWPVLPTLLAPLACGQATPHRSRILLIGPLSRVYWVLVTIIVNLLQAPGAPLS